MPAEEEKKVPLLNPILAKEKDDHLYHFGISRSNMDIPSMFGNVKFVCVGGSAPRFQFFAQQFAREAKLGASSNLSNSDRFVMYKTGPVLWVNHGMGNPSISIMLVEVIKLLHYAGVSSPKFFRIGTSGGLNVEPGTVIVSSGAMNGELQEGHIQYIMGKKIVRATSLDAHLQSELIALAKELGIKAETGETFCADDFYEGQARLDGEFCEYTADAKFNFLRQLSTMGVRNIEMESTCFASMCHRAGIKAAVVCVTLLDRMKGDQINLDKMTYTDFEMRPYQLVSAYMRRELGLFVGKKSS